MFYLLSRFVQMIVIVAVLSVALFGLLSAMPGNPVDMLITSNPRIKPEDVVRLKKLRGLDQPWYIQYVRWMWGYHDPLRPAELSPVLAVKTADNTVTVDLKESLLDPNVHLTKNELKAILQKDRPGMWEKLQQDPVMVDVKDQAYSEHALEQIAGYDTDFYNTIVLQLKENARRSIQVEGLFGAQANGLLLTQKMQGPGMHRLWYIARNRAGLEQLGFVPVPVGNNATGLPIMSEIPAQVVDDPQSFHVDLKQFVRDEKVKTPRFSLVDSPGKIDANGRYTHVFDKPGQSVIRFTVEDGLGIKDVGAFAVEHGPIPDPARFNRGFLFFFVGDKEALGFSSTYKRPVWELLFGTPSEEKSGISAWLLPAGRIGNTLQLMLPAILLSLLIALPLGILSAYRQYSWLDYIVNFFAFIGISLPVFWFGIMVMFIFAEHLQWLPAGGIQTPDIDSEGFWAVMSDRFKHAILPTLVLSIAYVGRWMRYMRASMLEILPADYIRTARAKGLAEKAVILKHALRNALIPVVTILALSIPALFGGAVLTETVFSWPGIGRLEYDAVVNSDYYVAIVVFLISSVLVMLGNLLADVVYVFVDPRIRNS